MARPDLPVSLLLRTVPNLAELAVLRRALVAASSTDARREWSGSASYATYEQRVLSLGEMSEAIRASYRESVQRTRRIHKALRRAMSAIALDEGERAVREIIALGSAAEEQDHWQDAVAFHELAISVCSMVNADPPLQVLAQRSAGRARLRAGDLGIAHAHYRAALDTAELHELVEHAVIALTGLGNLASLQGRWSDASDCYHAALRRAENGFPALRGQLWINLSMIAREQGSLADAQRALDQARQVWDDVGSADRAVWFNNQGLLHLRTGSLDPAETAFADALEQAPGQFDVAMIYENLAEVCTRRGQMERAEAYARRSEEYALSVGSDRALAEAYLRLARLHQQRRDAGAVTFFEQAVTVARRGPFPLVQARAHHAYARYRSELGDHADAKLHLTEAVRLFNELGATDAADAAATDLETLCAKA